jgi:hypothetical protein
LSFTPSNTPNTDSNFLVNLKRRKEILLDAFGGRRLKALAAGHTPFATLVKKLQESLTRMESFDVVTVAQGSDGQLAHISMLLCFSFFDRLKAQLSVTISSPASPSSRRRG